ncbi:MAG: ATP-binding protein [Anaerolineae bacterium]|nr:ATP-binding protein [Anaerolineae bacterium]
MINRVHLKSQITERLAWSRAVVLIGPRQCGKTTLARQFVAPDSANYFDLEDPVNLARLEQPMTALSPLTGLVVIDEVQRRPDLFPVLRVLLDRNPLPAKFLILGSAGPSLLQQSSESLAGRISMFEMRGFTLAEVGAAAQMTHWVRGAYPPAYLADTDQQSVQWRRDLLETVVTRDVLQNGHMLPTVTVLRLLHMLAHYHGQLWNASELATSLGISQPTIKRYVDTFEGLLMLRQLRPWYENLGKRQVKTPKLYIRDTGLLHQLLGIRTQSDLFNHPKSGASWEGYAIEEVIGRFQTWQPYFWSTHNQAELDLFLTNGSQRIGVECKRVDAPRLTPSMQIAINDLKLDRLFVIYPGAIRYSIAEKIEAMPLNMLASPEFSLV